MVNRDGDRVPIGVISRSLRRAYDSVLARVLTKPARERLLQRECAFAVRWASSAHQRLMAVQWGGAAHPEHFDHHIDLFYQWLASRNSLWVERGVFGSLALRGGDVLELACGDGFNARNFYSLRSTRVLACDVDPSAIEVASRKNSAPNVEFRLADIRTSMPDGLFENVIWDAAIEHFTPDEISQIMRGIRARLEPRGVLSGYTIVEGPAGKSLSHHEYEFKSKEDLMRFLTPHFANVTVFETKYPGRHNLYFWASDADLPFGRGWPNAISTGA
jgi:SAM-dependent methyltransferase